eukprot:TRINITY_DN1469_c0_g1_i7.p1 TRINITY_DN1469_c0_g1~~TRINITY_DN1469_c0_g1_i7.p1  ORF type:complete len:311 (-),score=57.93 TRINITY_DN1469_c0_g1_i7:691-1623(-)
MVGTSIEANQISPWFTLVDPSAENWEFAINGGTLDGTQILAEEQAHRFTLRSVSHSGVMSMTGSQLIRVDASPPECESSQANIIATRFTEENILEVDIEWSACFDNESGLAGLMVVNSQDPASPDVLPFTVDPGFISTSVNTTDLPHNHMIAFSVIILNYAGLSNPLSGSISLDLTPPSIDIVRDGPRPITQENRDLDCITTTSTFGVNWDDAIEPESSVVLYEACFGTQQQLCDVVPFTKTIVGDGTRSFTFTDVVNKVSVGQVYYASIRVTNSFGETSVKSSDGVRVVCSADDEECLHIYGAFSCLSF